MKILEIRFKNINSIAGEWRVDLTDPAFADGLFLISGPTGSGKTSVLDAMTLALYGQTVREKVTNDRDEVMTRGGKASSASVAFLSDDGTRYRATWEHARTRTGTFRKQTRRLENLDTGTDLTPHNAKELDDLIARTVGLGYTEFTRTILLAQGAFDRFLKASDKDRGAILERTTGTERFAEIGCAIFRRMQVEKAEAERRRDVCKIFEAVPAQACETLSVLLDEKRRASAALARELETLRRSTEWARRDAKQRENASLIAADRERLDIDLAAFAPKRERLARAKAARRLDAVFREKKGAEEACARAGEALSQRGEEAARTEKAAAETGKFAREAVAVTEEFLRRMDARMPLVESARKLEDALRESRKRLDLAEREEATANRKRVEVDSQAAETVAERERTERLLALAERFLRDGSTPGEDECDASPLLRAIKRARALEAEAEAKKREAEGRRSEADAASARFADAAVSHEALADAQEKRILAQEELLRFARSAMDLEAHRAELHDGKPCPLCGATEHPWASPGAALPDVERAIAALEEAKREKRAADAAFEEARAKKDDCVASANEAERQAEKIRLRAEQEKGKVASELAKLGERVAFLRANESRYGDLRREAALEADGRLKESLEARRVFQEVQARRAALPVRDPDAEEKELRLNAKENERRAQEAKEKAVCAAQRAHSAKTECEAAERAAVRAEAEAAAARERFAAALVSSAFADESDWLDACWTDEAMDAAEAEIRRLSERETVWRTRREENLRERERLDGEPHEARPPDELEAALAAKEVEKREVDQSLGSIREQLDRNGEALRQKAAAESAYAEQKIVSERWNRLNKWLGGEGGDNFRQYAQGLTLRELLRQANPYLLEMSRGRYEMIWLPEEGASRTNFLLPKVVDHDREDAVRPVSNLSGGETFQLSLALALGLSRLSMRNLTVGTMFLDEGFGTLDGESLELALQTLSGLRESGRCVGVITHVEAVKEKIAARIEVCKTGRGFSSLSGAGVTRL